jgi:fatty-acyl-CoA synthase
MNKDTPPRSIYDTDLNQVAANYVPLTPLSFLQRSSTVYRDKTAVIHGDHRYSYREFGDRCRRLAGALAAHGIGRSDTVSVMAPNVPAMLEAHYGVPMTGAVLNALNYRLDAATISFILNHAQTKVLITDREFSDTIRQAIKHVKHPLLIIDIDDPFYEGGELLGECDYESFLRQGEADFIGPPLEDEWQAISLNYTSGTTGNPKGVVYHHRGAYLNALGQILAFNLSESSIYLWTLPMFHCNGWTYTWGVTAAAGTHVCLRRVDPALIFPMIKQHGVTHMCGAPIVLNMLVHAPVEQRADFGRTVEVATGGAAPPSKVIAEMEGLGFRVTHLYGLTETYGPATVCAWQHAWAELDLEERTGMMARQGVAYHTLEDIMIADPKTMEPVPSDGETMGELMVRGNTAMKGYLKNPNATNEAFLGGWFHTGDLGVRHPSGYVEIKDRAKDVIISGGENVSSLEVEEMLYRHPSIMEAAVVARPDEHWGETVCAFVTLKPDAGDVAAEDIIAWCRQRLAKFKSPKHVVFEPLPKTPTGKIQKFVLRDKAKEL